MMPSKSWLAVVVLMGAIFQVCAAESLRVTQLTCEHLVNPLGIDQLQPRLSWICESTARGAHPTAYRIVVASDTQRLSADLGDLWDSGKVSSSESVLIRYAGKPLAARQACQWKVMVWSADDQPSAWSATASFEIGLPTAADWQAAQWMQLAVDSRTSPLAERVLTTDKASKNTRTFPAPLMRRTLRVRPGLQRARAYVCGLGLHELYCNGERVGDGVLESAPTTYDVRALYNTYDLTTRLTPGANAIGLQLGNGFFGQNGAFLQPNLAWGAPTAVARIVLDYADGSSESVLSDGAWKATTGPIQFDNLYAGESYDARSEIRDWARADCADHAWSPVALIAAPTTRIEAQLIPPCRRIRELPPTDLRDLGNGRWLADLGHNIAGWVRLSVNQPAGTTITLRFAEFLSEDRTQLDTQSTGHFATGCVQTDIYVCRGGERETWEPRFTYHGFRYVEIAGCTSAPTVTGIVVNTDLAVAGSFSSSDPLLNRLHDMAVRTIAGNLHGLTEDCPHRERCAWLGDAHAQTDPTLFNFAAQPLFAKFMADVETTLGKGGKTYEGLPATPGIPCNVAVGRRLPQEARPDWGVAVVLIPWSVYQFTGDDSLLKTHYPLMARWVDYVTAMAKDGIINQGYGDWYPPGGNPGGGKERMECPVPLSSTAYHYGALTIMSQVATMFGHAADATRFAADGQRIRAACNARFFDPKTTSYGSQTANVLALRFDLVPEGQRQAVGDALARNVTVDHQGHAFVGFHGGVGLYTLLGDAGHVDVAHHAMTVPGFPGFAHLVALDYTTFPEVMRESLDSVARLRSSNHPMQTGFATWFYDSVGGIRPTAPGFRSFALRPQLMRQLASAAVMHRGPYGEIRSAFTRQGGAQTWTVNVPVGSTATAWIPTDDASTVRENGQPLADSVGLTVMRREPGAVVCQLAAGNYQFTTPLAAAP